MAKGSKDNPAMAAAAAMRTIQDDAYLALIEWPVVLVHRLKEVEAHLTVTSQEPQQAEKTVPAFAPNTSAAAPDPALTSSERRTTPPGGKKALSRGIPPKAARSAGGESIISRRKSPAPIGQGVSPDVSVAQKPGASEVAAIYVTADPSMPAAAADKEEPFSLFDNLEVKGANER